MDHLPTIEDDGLVTPEVGDWAEDKYQLVKCYATIFSNSMSGTWGLGFFSKNALGTKFWKECQKYTNPQRPLF